MPPILDNNTSLGLLFLGGLAWIMFSDTVSAWFAQFSQGEQVVLFLLVTFVVLFLMASDSK